jgi:hypothetical protein
MREVDAMTTHTLTGDFVLLRAGSLRLVLPQADVGAAAYLDGDADASTCIALSDEGTPLARRPAGRFIAVSLRGGDPAVRWCWDEMRVLIASSMRSHAVPDVLLADDALADRYVELDGEVVFVTDATRLTAHALATGAMS